MPAHVQGEEFICLDACSPSWRYNFNSICENGGPGSESNSCEYGTDCSDCGLRGAPPSLPPSPSPPPAPPGLPPFAPGSRLCSDECAVPVTYGYDSASSYDVVDFTSNG
eukprot:946157-Pleurochrysis_carterae.AAC.1